MAGKIIYINKIKQVMIVFITFIFIALSFSGCIQREEPIEGIEKNIIEGLVDNPAKLPEWNDEDYHDYYHTTDLLLAYQIQYPNLVNVFSIGTSVKDLELWCIQITNKYNTQHKYTCLIDGCIHGCEWEAGEACLYLSEYLLINFDHNDTITDLLNTTEIYIVPMLNPDGRQQDSRFNENGIDLNRNFDIDFGRIRGHSMPLGKIFGRIKIPYLRFDRLNKWFPQFPRFLTNSGRRPFTEPESQALRDLMQELDTPQFSFYVNCHTAVHTVSTPWHTFKPPFELSQNQQQVHQTVLKWVVENTEYENGDMSFDGYSYTASGTATDWCFKEFQIPSFTFEILSKDYEPAAGGGRHDSLVHWMKTTLPFFMYLLVNIKNLNDWQTPERQPLLPDGVPPEPLQ